MNRTSPSDHGPQHAVDDHAADVWLAAVTDPPAGRVAQAYKSMLCQEELQRYHAFRFERDRSLYLQAHVLVRTTLSRYYPIEPSAWRFSTNRYGRPEIDTPGVSTAIRFNLSHTRGLAACIVTNRHDCGVDVEEKKPIDDVDALARYVFAPAEVAELQRLDSRGRLERFFYYWTLKEAYIKARGMGLALPLAEFSFAGSRDGQIRITFAGTISDRPSNWTFFECDVTPRHKLALAVRRPATLPLAVKVKTVDLMTNAEPDSLSIGRPQTAHSSSANRKSWTSQFTRMPSL